MPLRADDVLHVHVDGLGALPRSLRAALLSPATLVVHLHETSSRPVLDGRSATLRHRLLGAPVEHVLLRRARLVVAPMRATAELATALGARQVVTPVPAALPAPAALERIPVRPDPRLTGRRVVSVGPIVPHRRLRDLVEALTAQSSDTHLVLLGAGPDEDRLRHVADHLGVGDRFHVRRHPTYADVDAHLRHADVVATASVVGEGPFALLRAMQLGRPVVAVDADDRRRIISSQVDGLLVPIGHRSGLAGALRQVLTDAPLAESLDAGAQELVAGARGSAVVLCETLREIAVSDPEARQQTDRILELALRIALDQPVDEVDPA